MAPAAIDTPPGMPARTGRWEVQPPEVSTHDLLSVAAFAVDLRFTYGNRHFTRLTGRRPHDLHGRSWLELFPGTSTDDQQAILGVAAGQSSSADVELVLPHVHPAARRAGDRSAHPARACRVHPAAVHRIRPGTRGARLAVVAPRLDPAEQTQSSRVSALSTMPDATRWLEPLIAASTHRDRRVAVFGLALDRDPGGRSGPARAGSVTPLGLAQGLTARFRAHDRIGVLGNRWVLLACPGVQQPAAGGLYERFRAACHHLTGSRPHDPSGDEFAMTLGDHLDHAADVLQRLRLNRR